MAQVLRNGLRIKGHPIHPMLVGLPVTFYITTLIGDVAYLSTGALFWHQLAWLTNFLAVGFGSIAALAGFAEYFTISKHSPAKKTANLHAIINLGIFALFFAALLVRSADGFGLPDIAPPGIRSYALTVFSLIGVGALTVAGWLGWELVYKHRIGVDTGATAATTLPQKGPVFNESNWDTNHSREVDRPPSNPGDVH